MIVFRIDVDYPFPSRTRSFFFTAFGIRLSKDYLLNSKIIARMINETSKPVKAYWFFTIKTMPDEQLLKLLNNDRHEVSLHIVNDPYSELEKLERATSKQIHYYTIHGTARFISQLMWRRKGREAKIPQEYPLKDFTKLPTTGFALDSLCYNRLVSEVIRTVEKREKEGTDYILYFHPIWLFQRGKLNQRGPFYQVLRSILGVDKELDSIALRRRLFFALARDWNEYVKDVIPTDELLQKLNERKVDVFTFLERRWTRTVSNPDTAWAETDDNIAILDLTRYDEWLKSVGKKTRNMIRKAEKSGITTRVAEPNGEFADGMWKIYNETPIRQERAFPHFGISLQTIKQTLRLTKNAVYIGAYLQGELVGFIQLIEGDNIVIISQILSMQKHWGKAVNNALVAKAIEYCAANRLRWIMYGRMGNHPSLDNFKQNNGFTKLLLNRYHVALTGKGKLAIKIGLNKEIKDSLPQALKTPLFPVYNWISRNKTRLRRKRE